MRSIHPLLFFLFGIGRSPEDVWKAFGWHLQNIRSFSSTQILNNNNKSRFSLEAGFFLAIQKLSDEEIYTRLKKHIKFTQKKRPIWIAWRRTQFGIAWTMSNRTSSKTLADERSSESLDTKSQIHTPLVFTPYGRLWFQKLLLKNSQLINELSYSHLYFSKNL